MEARNMTTLTKKRLSRIVIQSLTFLAVWSAFLLFAGWMARAQDSVTVDSSAGEGQEYLLRYKFEADQALSWDVAHRTSVRTIVGGISQEDESRTQSKKNWRVVEVGDEGNAVIEHMVSDISMTTVTGGVEQSYDSTADVTEDVHVMFKSVAESVNKPLFNVTVSPRGEEVDRERIRASLESKYDRILIVFPEEAISVGSTWTHSFDKSVALPNGIVRSVRLRKQYSLESVRTGVAVFSVTTQVLTPIHDPELEAQLLQDLWQGEYRFDLDAGYILEQQLDIDESCINFRGEGSSIRYQIRATEEISD
jgi:hypothetical protein